MEDIVTLLRLQSFSGARTGQTWLEKGHYFCRAVAEGGSKGQGPKFSVSSSSEVSHDRRDSQGSGFRVPAASGRGK